MVRARAVVVRSVVLACLLWLAPAVRAQQSGIGIAGSVKDTAGLPVAGVTVEAASPALIEKVRAAVTDGQGQYKILDLLPGSYVVTFKASGFNTVRQGGVELVAGYTAAVNALLKAGNPEETITVTGTTTVDTQNNRQQQVLSDATLDSLPTSSKSLSSVTQTNAAVQGGVAGSDVGGSGGFYLNQGDSAAYHGKVGIKRMYDGLGVENAEATGNTGIMINSLYTQEIVTEIGGGNAEAIASGAIMNNIPKSGSNNFAYNLTGLYSGENMESNNLTQALRDQGLTSSTKVVKLYDGGALNSGPIKKDTLWYFLSYRNWGSVSTKAGIYANATQDTLFYTPDLAHRGIKQEFFRSYAGRLTYLASPRLKLSLLADINNNQKGYGGTGENVAVEADTVERFWPQALTQLSLSAPVTKKLLVTGGLSWMISHWPTTPSGTGATVSVFDFPITESSTGFLYKAPTTETNMLPPGSSSCWYLCRGLADSDRLAQRFGMSYITGSHAFKIGIQTEQIYNNKFAYTPGTPDLRIGAPGFASVAYTFNNQKPSAITEYSGPNVVGNYTHDMGIFVQDQWTLKHLTMNLGLRYDTFNGFAAETPANVTNFGSGHSFPARSDIPAWKDFNPRFGAAYDLFGNGRTALKMSVGRFVSVQGVGIPAANNPYTASGTSTTRSWTDTNGNFYPDCDLHNPASNGECGALANATFGQGTPITRYDPAVLNGFNARDYTWDSSFEVVHQFTRSVSANFGYYRNQFYNFLVTDNTAVSPADYQSYCLPAPSDSRLPGGGGYQLCGLTDISPASFGKTTNLVTKAQNFGTMTKVNDFFGGNVNARLPRGVRLGGGVDFGRSVSDRCFVIDNPAEAIYDLSVASTPTYCHVVIPWSANLSVKANASYPLPAGFAVSGTFQNTPGPQILATYAAPTSLIAPSLGRNLAACGTRTVCASTAAVPLIQPGTMYEPRKTQLDIRLSKTLKVGRRLSVQGKFDAYNVLNSSWVQSVTAAYGPQWLRPLTIINGRLFQVSTSINF